MVKYERELVNPTLLQASTLDLMQTPHFPRPEARREQQQLVAGLGWWVINYDNRRVVGHNGSILGFASNITRFLDDEITVIVFCNLDAIVRPDAIAKEIAGYYCPAIASLPLQPPMR